MSAPQIGRPVQHGMLWYTVLARLADGAYMVESRKTGALYTYRPSDRPSMAATLTLSAKAPCAME